MKRNFKIAVASVLSASLILSMTACSESDSSGNGDTPTSITTNAEFEAVQEYVAELTDTVDNDIVVEKKIKWLSWWDIDETQAAAELFKTVYGIPEEGDTSYGAYADCIFQRINVAYADRYDQLGKMVASGTSPDIFQFEIINFPYTAYKGLFQPIDDYIDFSSSLWDPTREAMKQFQWGGKNYCALTTLNLDQVLWYKRSVVAEAGLKDPYDLYKEGNWTWDTFLEMCDTFSDPDNGKYCIDGWQVPDRLVSTTGKAIIEINDEGKLQSNIYDADIERCMTTLIDVLYKENYRYPRHELNGWGINLMAWVTGDTLFYADLATCLKDSFQPYIQRYNWEDGDLFFVPFPKDPNADAYYQVMKNDSYMLCGGSQNTEGFTAWTECLIATSYDDELAAISRDQLQTNYLGYTDEICDFLDELQFGGVLTPVFDFKGGIGQDIVDSNTVYNPVDCLTQIPYLNCLDVDGNPVTFTTLRASNEGTINARIADLNATVS